MKFCGTRFQNCDVNHATCIEKKGNYECRCKLGYIDLSFKYDKFAGKQCYEKTGVKKIASIPSLLNLNSFDLLTLFLKSFHLY